MNGLKFFENLNNKHFLLFKLRYEKEKEQLNAKHKENIESMEILLKDKSERISALEKYLETEIHEKRQLVKSVMGVVKNVNIDSQSNLVSNYLT